MLNGVPLDSQQCPGPFSCDSIGLAATSVSTGPNVEEGWDFGSKYIFSAVSVIVPAHSHLLTEPGDVLEQAWEMPCPSFSRLRSNTPP